MLLGLLGLPVLAGIYWLRSRSRPRVVSSLFLWSDQRNPRQGGRRIEKLQTPLTFFLELIALAAIALAAAAPGLVRSRLSRPLIVVLDDSFSMQAGDKTSVRDRAKQKLMEEFRRQHYVARVILAGRTPRLLSEVIRTSDQLTAVLKEWKCTSPSANLDAALALAAEIGGETSRLLVVSDHAPATTLTSPRLQWWGLGIAEDNFALTAASRSTAEGGLPGQGDRVLLEIANFSKLPRRARLTLTGATGPEPREQSVELTAGGSNRIVLTLPPGELPLLATLGDDALKFDNQSHLLSPRQRLLRVHLKIAASEEKGESLRKELVRAFEATGQVVLSDSHPDLTVTNLTVTDQDNGAEAEGHRWVILDGKEPVSYEGPFILDRTHPLTSGLSLDAVVWSAPGEGALSGPPVVTAGNRVLMTDTEDTRGVHEYRMLLVSELSTLTASPDWPILITNLVRTCLSSLPGPSEVNMRLEQPLTVTLSDDALTAATAEVTAPDRTVRSLPVHGRRLELQGDQPGVYQVQAGSMQFSFAVNAFSRDESNLSACETGTWGEWNDAALPQQDRLSLDWICILIALSCLVLELLLLSRSGVTGS